MLGAKFLYCDMKNADLRGAYLWMGSFLGCNLSGANLAHVNCGYDVNFTELEQKISTLISFCDADLRGADLSYGDFTGGDFRGALLNGCIMTGAILKNALIDISYKEAPDLALTENQRREISWV